MLCITTRTRKETSFLRPITPLTALIAAFYLASCGSPNENQSVISKPQEIKNENSVVASSTAAVKKGLVKINGNWTPRTYEDHGNYALIEGHIRIPEGSFKEATSTDDQSLGLLAQGSRGQIAREYLWPNMKVPYSLSKDLDNRAKENFGSAIAMYHASTPIRFLPATNTDKDFLEVIKTIESACGWAYTGRQAEAVEGYAKNVLAISHTEECLNDPRNVGLVAHELAHAIGLGHEFSRPDRGSFIKVNSANLKLPGKYTFDDIFPIVSGFVFGPFDFNSITMYGPFVFKLAKEKHKPIITDINGKINFAGGVSLSPGDMRGIAKLYESQGAPTLKAAIADQELGLNQSRTLDFEVVNIPSCSNVRISRGEVIQKSSSPTQCSVTISGGSAAGYSEVDLKLFKEMTQRRTYDSFTRTPIVDTVGDESKPFSIERFRVKVGNPSQAPLDITTNILSALGERSSFIGPNIGAQQGILKFQTHSNVMGDEHFYLVSGPDEASFVVLGNVLTSTAPLTKDRYQVQITATNRAGMSVTKPFEFFTKLPQQRNINVSRDYYRPLQYRIASSNSLCIDPPADAAPSVWIRYDVFQSLMPNIQISNIYGSGGLGHLVETQSQKTRACVAPTPSPSPTQVARAAPIPSPTPSPIEVFSPEVFVCPNFLNLSASDAGLSFSLSRAMQNGRTVSVSSSSNNIVSCALSFAGGAYQADRSCKRYGRGNSCLEYYQCVEKINLNVSATGKQHDMWQFPRVVGTATRIGGCRYSVPPITINVSTTTNMSRFGLSLQYQNCRLDNNGTSVPWVLCSLKNPGDTYSCSAGVKIDDSTNQFFCRRK